jgi:energy-coupling factor transporter ATP-binding protein EcfA2
VLHNGAVIERPIAGLAALVDRLEPLVARRLADQPWSPSGTERARRLRDHLAGHVRVRVRSLDAPLLVLIAGPTGAGKSTLFNTIAGRRTSATGVLRPTTRVAVVLVNPDDRAPLLDGTLAGIDRDRLRFVDDPVVPPGLALLDAPDLDSIEHTNRDLADRLVEAADLGVFVTTATRYADKVPWDVLARIRERGLPMVVVVNRMPPDADDQREVLEDVARLLDEAGFRDATTDDPESPVDLIGVAEGDIDGSREALRPEAVASLTTRIANLRADREGRRALAARALAGALAGLGPLVDKVADDCEHEAIDVAATQRIAHTAFTRELTTLRDAVSGGGFLRQEALRQWQSFVGADQITRLFSRGIGRLRGMLASVVRPARAPVAEVREATTEDLTALARVHAAEAARRTATAWAEIPAAEKRVGSDPAAWTVSSDFDERLKRRLDAWVRQIGEDIQARGPSRRALAWGASIGVNAIGTGVMLATFIHTAGLTGAEVGVAAATAFLNHRLLSALFGEAAMVELVSRARSRLGDLLAETFTEEEARFNERLPSPTRLSELGHELRGVADELRELPLGESPELPVRRRRRTRRVVAP